MNPSKNVKFFSSKFRFLEIRAILPLPFQNNGSLTNDGNKTSLEISLSPHFVIFHEVGQFPIASQIGRAGAGAGMVWCWAKSQSQLIVIFCRKWIIMRLWTWRTKIYHDCKGKFRQTLNLVDPVSRTWLNVNIITLAIRWMWMKK